jgi:23S rRNA maturation mini-RNase III
MAKKRNVKVAKVVVDKNAAQFMRTAQNLFNKGKTNKKLRGRNANAKAIKYAIAQ